MACFSASRRTDLPLLGGPPRMTFISVGSGDQITGAETGVVRDADDELHEFGVEKRHVTEQVRDRVADSD
jgi:hypothetical protein